MPDNPVAVEIARLGHEAWRRQMLKHGWKPGEGYREKDKVHDALVPWEELSPADRRLATVNIECDGICDRLIRLAAPDRSPARPFSLKELQVGLPVGAAGMDDPQERAEPGRVESWTTEGDGEVAEITIKWADGSLEVIDPFERVIRRL